MRALVTLLGVGPFLVPSLVVGVLCLTYDAFSCAFGEHPSLATGEAFSNENAYSSRFSTMECFLSYWIWAFSRRINNAETVISFEHICMGAGERAGAREKVIPLSLGFIGRRGRKTLRHSPDSGLLGT